MKTDRRTFLGNVAAVAGLTGSMSGLVLAGEVLSKKVPGVVPLQTLDAGAIKKRLREEWGRREQLTRQPHCFIVSTDEHKALLKFVEKWSREVLGCESNPENRLFFKEIPVETPISYIRLHREWLSNHQPFGIDYWVAGPNDR